MKDWLKHRGAGRLLYHGFHRPLAAAEACLRDGGPIGRWKTGRGRREMEAAAASLAVPEPASGAPLVLHVLTGARFWYQTAFCLWTFARHAGRTLAPVFHDDGTLGGTPRERLLALFPAGCFVPRQETVERLDRHLPAGRFPFLRERWLNYPNIRKLIDVHAGQAGWKLVVDSDLLFFRRPGLLIDWLDLPDRPLHAVDVETSYGYPLPMLADLAGRPVAERINVGLTGLRGEDLDWERLEAWCRALIERAGTHYYLEQALVAMLVAGKSCAVAPAADYVTLPVPPEAEECSAVMHHYVAGSKRWYFRSNWRRALA